MILIKINFVNNFIKIITFLIHKTIVQTGTYSPVYAKKITHRKAKMV